TTGRVGADAGGLVAQEVPVAADPDAQRAGVAITINIIDFADVEAVLLLGLVAGRLAVVIIIDGPLVEALADPFRALRRAFRGDQGPPRAATSAAVRRADLVQRGMPGGR